VGRSGEAQIAELEQVHASLQGLLAFVDEQRVSVRNQERVLKELNEERARLEPMVSLDRETLLEAWRSYDRERMAMRGRDLWLAFSMGVVSSFVASAGFWLLVAGRGRRRRDANGGILSSGGEAQDGVPRG
jgi:hypothetical protein